MKRLFISQPMRGKTDEEILAERTLAVQVVKERTGEDVGVIDSFFAGTTLSPLECLGESLKLLAKADIAYFTRGWEGARGCVVEWMCAEEYGIPYIVE